MALWTPYKEDFALDLTKRQPPDPTNTMNFMSPHQQTMTSEAKPSYHYIGYDPIPLNPEQSDSGYSSGSSSPHPKLKISRPFKQMTSGTGSSISTNLRNYYNQVLRHTETSNPRMRRPVVGILEEKETDIDYLERRSKNNAAAKRSRELRKVKEDQLALNLAYLEAENERLNVNLNFSKEKLKMLILQRSQAESIC